MYDILDGKPLLKKPLNRGRGRSRYLRIHHRLPSVGPLLPGNLDIDGRLVYAPLSDRLFRVHFPAYGSRPSTVTVKSVESTCQGSGFKPAG